MENNNNNNFYILIFAAIFALIVGALGVGVYLLFGA